MDPEQYALLDTLIYLEAFTKGKYDDNTVAQILTSTEVRAQINTNPPALMSTQEWEDVINAALSDPAIASLQVSHMDVSDTGGRRAYFSNQTNQVAVFAGTGANQWRSDAVAGTQVLSVEQQGEMNWLEGIRKDNEGVVFDVSGHSNGGNAALLAKLWFGNQVGQCYSIDGQGISLEAIRAFVPEIALYRDDMHLIANHRDFVHVLLYSVAGSTYFVTNEDLVGSFPEFHKPNAVLSFIRDANGNVIGYGLGQQGPEDKAVEFLGGFTRYLSDNAPYGQRRLCLSVLGEYLTLMMAGGDGGAIRQDIIDQFGFDGIAITLQYFDEYMDYLKRTDPALYDQYSIALGKLLQDYVFDIPLLTGEQGTAIFLVSEGLLPFVANVTQAITSKATIRDFSQSTKTALLDTVKEVESEVWWDVSRWDCWYRLEQLGCFVNVFRDFRDVDDYQRKLIDINNASAQRIEEIFTNVKGIDEQYARTVRSHTTNITDATTKIGALASSFGASGA